MVPAVSAGFTVTTAVLVQPVLLRYVMVEVPREIPVNNPEPVPIVATDGVLLIHDTPVGDASVTTLLLPTQIERLPAIGTGRALTVTLIVREQPEPKE